jgi:glycerophosphoryl diester phosphodiesterase
VPCAPSIGSGWRPLKGPRTRIVWSVRPIVGVDVAMGRSDATMGVVVTRIPGLWRPPVLFAHRGARAHARENTIEAFELALRLGATGLETDVWRTADGRVVLDHDGIHRRLPRRSIADVDRSALRAHIPTLEEFYAAVGTEHPLSVDVKDPEAFDPMVRIAREHEAAHRLWVCHWDLDLLVEWRARAPEVRLVNSTRLERLPQGPERRAAELARERIDAVNLRRRDWTGGLTTLFHRFEVLSFGWDAQHDHQIEALIDMGIDAVYSDHVDRLHTVWTQRFGAGPNRTEAH